MPGAWVELASHKKTCLPPPFSRLDTWCLLCKCLSFGGCALFVYLDWFAISFLSVSLTLGVDVQRGLRYLSCMSVCLSVTTFSAPTVQRGNKIAIRGGLLLLWQGDFCKTAVFKSYGLKTKQMS